MDRHRSCRHVDLGHSAAVASRMANVDQPVRRSDDLIRRGLRGSVSALAHGSAMVLLLDVSLPQHDESLAAISQPAGLGRVCGVDLFHRLAAVLVHRPRARHGHAARSLGQSAGADCVWRVGHGLARFGVSLAAIRSRLFDSGRPRHAACGFGPHGRELRFRRRQRSRLALDNFSALLCGRRDLFRFRDGPDPLDSAALLSTSSKISLPSGIWKTWPRLCSRRD